MQINILPVCVIYVLSMLGLTCGITDDSSGIEGVKVAVNYPVRSIDDEVQYQNDSVFVYYHNGFVIYQIHYNQLNFVDYELKSHEVRFRYFFYRSGDKYGVMYDSLNVVKERGIPWPVDSILFRNGFRLSVGLIKDSFRLVNAVVNDLRRTEVYAINNTIGEWMFDSMYLFYDKRFSTRHVLDSVYDKKEDYKLYKLDIIFNEFSSAKTGRKVPVRRLQYEIIPLKEVPGEVEVFMLNREARYMTGLN